MKNIETVIWDMDGVLVDTGQYHFLSWKNILHEYDIEFTYNAFLETFGMNNEGLLNYLFQNNIDPEQYREIGDRKESLFREMIRGKISLIAGVNNWLEEFNHLDIEQTVASSAPLANIDQILREVAITHYFSRIKSAENLPGKPDPAVFLLIAGEVGSDPENCLVIEDSLAGIKAAKNAGMWCVGVTNTNPADQLWEADYVYEQLGREELLSMNEFCFQPKKSR